MAGLYVYAIVDRAPVSPLAWSGVGGGTLASVPYRDIAAVVSPAELAEIPALPTHVCHHETIVEALMAAATVLPVRFGTVVPGRDQLQVLLASNYGAFTTSLQRVRGKVELGLRVLWTHASSTTPAHPNQVPSLSTLSGRQYLMIRLGEEWRTEIRRRSAELLATTLHRPLAELAHASSLQVLRTPRLLLSATYLVDTSNVGRVRAAVDALAETQRGLQFLLTGPWPPYHFVAADDPASVASGTGGVAAHVFG